MLRLLAPAGILGHQDRMKLADQANGDRQRRCQPVLDGLDVAEHRARVRALLVGAVGRSGFEQHQVLGCCEDAVDAARENRLAMLERRQHERAVVDRGRGAREPAERVLGAGERVGPVAIEDQLGRQRVGHEGHAALADRHEPTRTVVSVLRRLHTCSC